MVAYMMRSLVCVLGPDVDRTSSGSPMRSRPGGVRCVRPESYNQRMGRRSPPAAVLAERRVGIESWKAFATIIVAQAAFLALAIAVFLRGEDHRRFPASVPAPPAAHAIAAFVPVSFARARNRAGSTVTIAARGGRTSATSARRDHGVVGYRRASTSRAGLATP
jgi:hypothetical protein